MAQLSWLTADLRARSPSGILLAIEKGGGPSIMFAALSAVLIGVVGILFVRKRGARKRTDVAPAR
jgi:hypothetical protein